MSDHVFLSALLLAIPMSMKYLLAFEMRKKVAVLKARERQVVAMTNRLEALEREQDVVHGALVRIEDRRRWAKTRCSLIEREMQRRVGEWRTLEPQTDDIRATFDAVEIETLPATAETGV